jgi:hypothetical protein
MASGGMQRPCTSAYLAALVFFVSLVGARAQPLEASALQQSAEGAVQDQQLERARIGLLKAGDADSLAAAALLTIRAGQEPDRVSLAARASELAPGRADLAWLYLASCNNTPSCDPGPAVARLAASAPTNAARYAARTQGSQDSESDLDRLLAGMAATERFDIYWNALIALEAKALVRVGGATHSSAVVTAIGTNAAIAVPAYQRYVQACKGEALQRETRRDACRKVARVLMQGDTILTERIGQTIALRAWPPESPEWKQAAEMRRLTEFRMQARSASQLVREMADETRMTRYLGWLGSYRSEQEVLLADLRLAGLPTEPPPDWKGAAPSP